MSNSKIILAAAAFLLWLAARLPAETVTTTSMIESVDTTSRTITVRRKTAKGEKTAKLAVGSNVEIIVDGQSGDLASLKAGQSATISYDTTAKQVTGISVGSASAPSASGRGTNGVRVPDDAAAFEGHSYKFFREVMTWRQAKQRCERLGGHLATIGGEAENDFVTVLARSGIANPGRLDGVWLGATDERQEGEWRWLDGGKLHFANWWPGQPNNKQNAEHYLFLLLSDGTWHDQPDRSKQHVAYFVCEWDASGSRDASDEKSSVSGASSRAALPLIRGDTLDGWRPVPFTSNPSWSAKGGILTDLGGPSLATKRTSGISTCTWSFRCRRRATPACTCAADTKCSCSTPGLSCADSPCRPRTAVVQSSDKLRLRGMSTKGRTSGTP